MKEVHHYCNFSEDCIYQDVEGLSVERFRETRGQNPECLSRDRSSCHNWTDKRALDLRTDESDIKTV
jgi:hypothetical protein